jgi:DNA-binding CsgD family transcriptional regulator
MTDPNEDPHPTRPIDLEISGAALAGASGNWTTADIAGLAGVLRALGGSHFYEALVGWLTTFIPNDFWSIADFTRNVKPIIHNYTWPSADAESFYFNNIYQYDPIFHALDSQALMPVISDSLIREQYEIDPRYDDYMRNVARCADELFILVPRRAGASMVISLGREDRRFSVAEVYSARQISAFLVEIVQLHWQRSAIVGDSAAQPQLSDPRRPDFSQKIERFRDSFRLAPRESEITSLSLRGYSNSAMAKALGIGQGTIKNHKLRLFRKLDITNERELFPLFLDE